MHINHLLQKLILNSVCSGTIKEGIGKVFFRILSLGEGIVKDEFISSLINIHIDVAFENTDLGWTYNFVSLFDDLDEIVDSIVAEPNYCSDILNYCANDTDYLVYVELRNGKKHKIEEISTLIDKRE